MTFPLPQAYGDRIRHGPGVRGLVIRTGSAGYIRMRATSRTSFRVSRSNRNVFKVYTDLIPEDKEGLPAGAPGLHHRPRTGREANFHLGDRIPLKGDFYPVELELTVRGIMIHDLQTRDVLYFSREYLEQSLPSGPPARPVCLRSSAKARTQCRASPGDRRRVSQFLRRETKTESEAAFSLGFINSLGNVKLFLLSICGAVTFTILLVAGNTMAMTVRERVREMGILKTIGFTPARI